MVTRQTGPSLSPHWFTTTGWPAVNIPSYRDLAAADLTKLDGGTARRRCRLHIHVARDIDLRAVDDLAPSPWLRLDLAWNVPPPQPAPSPSKT